jgi:hypothetical protein
MALTTIEQQQAAGLARENTTSDSIAKPPSAFDAFIDRLFRGLTFVFAGLTIVLVLYIV